MSKEERMLFNLLMSGQVTLMSDADREKIATGEAKGFDGFGALVPQSQAEPCAEELFPYCIGDGADWLQIWVTSGKESFQKLHDVTWGDYGVKCMLGDREIVANLEWIFDEQDCKQQLRQVEFVSADVIKLRFGKTSEPWLRLGIAPSLTADTVITLDFTNASTMTLQVRQSASCNHRPHRKFLYKIKANEESGSERILGCWATGSGTVLYRIQNDQQTVEKYPDGVDLLIENL